MSKIIYHWNLYFFIHINELIDSAEPLLLACDWLFLTEHWISAVSNGRREELDLYFFTEYLFHTVMTVLNM